MFRVSHRNFLLNNCCIIHCLCIVFKGNKEMIYVEITYQLLIQIDLVASYEKSKSEKIFLFHWNQGFRVKIREMKISSNHIHSHSILFSLRKES